MSAGKGDRKGRDVFRQGDHPEAEAVRGDAEPDPSSLSASATGRRDAPLDGPVSPGAVARGHQAKARRKDAT